MASVGGSSLCCDDSGCHFLGLVSIYASLKTRFRGVPRKSGMDGDRARDGLGFTTLLEGLAGDTAFASTVPFADKGVSGSVGIFLTSTSAGAFGTSCVALRCMILILGRSTR